MIVCVCNAITEDEVRKVARCGTRCAGDAYARLDCEPQCGCCMDYMQEIIDEQRVERPNLRVVA